MKITDLKEHPINPRVIRDKRFKDLIKSIFELPNGLRYNRIKYNPETMEVLAGNMRTRALRFIHQCSDEEYEELVPTDPYSEMTREEVYEYFADYRATGELPKDWVEPVTDLTEKEMLDFMIKDNVQFGETDWDILKSEWKDKVDLVEAGFEDAAWLENEVDLDEFFTKHKDNIKAQQPTTKSIVLHFTDDMKYEAVQEWLESVESPEDAIFQLI